MTFKQVCQALRAGKYTSLGSYPTFFLTSDGDCLSHEAVRENIYQVGRAMRDFQRKPGYHYSDPAWRVIEHAINWEDEDMVCAHTGKSIECAYPNQDEGAA